jgi:hypothetical protein
MISEGRNYIKSPEPGMKTIHVPEGKIQESSANQVSLALTASSSWNFSVTNLVSTLVFK